MKGAIVTFGAWLLLGAVASTLAGEFVPGHIYVTVVELDPCDFGGEEGILQIDPVTGETTIFADSSDGICAASGLAFTPDGQRLRQLNAGHLLGRPDAGWVQEFNATGESVVILDGADGLADPVGVNGLAFDATGNFYLVNTSPSEILRFPVDGGPAQIFADGEDGLDDRGSIDFDPISGDLFYTGDLADVILRITSAGEASVFDIPPDEPQNLAFDTQGNLFLATNTHDGPAGLEYAIYRYDHGDAKSRRLLVSGFVEPCCSGFWPTALTVSPDDTQLYFAVGNLFAPGGFLYAVDPDDGSATVLADFSVFTDSFVMLTGIAVYDPVMAGDLDGDGDVDLIDYGVFQACFTGADGGPVRPECGSADLDNDSDVDLDDFATFQAAFTGP